MLVRILERIAKAVGWGFAVSIGVGAISGVVHGVLVACMDKPDSPENIAFAVQWGRATALIGTLAGLLLTVWLARKGRLQALSLLSAALCIFAILWVFICLLVWELNEIPHVSLRGLS